MRRRDRLRKLLDNPFVEWCLFVLGILLVLAGVLLAPIPGPGGIFLIAPGLALILKTSLWAKRNYVRFKRWQPKAGHLADRALRRPSARRREAVRKAQRSDASN